MMPGLELKLKQTGLAYKPEEFVKKTLLSACYLAIGFTLFLFLLLAKLKMVKIVPFIGIILFIILYFYLSRVPDVLITKRDKEISKEIVFAGRFLVIEIESGVPLYSAFVNLSRNYEVIGRYFKEIIDKVNLGSSIEEALDEAVELIPSQDLKRILWQIINSLKTGSDIAESLKSVIDQIAREQNIMIKEYGRKLNPLAMFYMIIAVILPSLGITMLIILSAFINFEVSLTILIVIAVLLGFLQFMFLSIIKFSRPPVEL